MSRYVREDTRHGIGCVHQRVPRRGSSGSRSPASTRRSNRSASRSRPPRSRTSRTRPASSRSTRKPARLARRRRPPRSLLPRRAPRPMRLPPRSPRLNPRQSGSSLKWSLRDTQGNFQPGNADLPDDARAKLDALATKLKENPAGNFIEIEGHTDSTGSPS